MYSFLAPIARLFAAAKPAGSRSGVARQLLESAEARAGHDPQEAQELRSAAYAFLRVVR